MNYFDLFEIPIQFVVDTAVLKKKYLLLNRKFHPDFFTNQEQDAKQEALEKTSLLNKAWQVFQDPLLTLHYALIQLGAIQEENTNPKLPSTFLQEMMEINELSMSEEVTDVEQCKKQITQIENELYSEVRDSIENKDLTTLSVPELEKIKDYYYKKKYLCSIQKRMEQMGH